MMVKENSRMNLIGYIKLTYKQLSRINTIVFQNKQSGRYNFSQGLEMELRLVETEDFLNRADSLLKRSGVNWRSSKSINEKVTDHNKL